MSLITETDTAKIIALLREYYPRDIESTDIRTKVKAWHMIIGDYTYQDAQAAAIAFASTDTKGFMPSPGQLVEVLSKLKNTNAMTELEAWGYVVKAVSNSLYNSAKEWDKLPEEVKNALGSPSVLREWAMIDADEFQTVIQSNFMRSYKARSAANQEYAKLPESVKKVAGALAGNMRMLPEERTGE